MHRLSNAFSLFGSSSSSSQSIGRAHIAVLEKSPDPQFRISIRHVMARGNPPSYFPRGKGQAVFPAIVRDGEGPEQRSRFFGPVGPWLRTLTPRAAFDVVHSWCYSPLIY
jgi:hypothetical protein